VPVGVPVGEEVPVELVTVTFVSPVVTGEVAAFVITPEAEPWTARLVRAVVDPIVPSGIEMSKETVPASPVRTMSISMFGKLAAYVWQSTRLAGISQNRLMKVLTNSRVSFVSKFLMIVKVAAAASTTNLTTVFGTQRFTRSSAGRSSSIFQSKTQISSSLQDRLQNGLRLIHVGHVSPVMRIGSSVGSQIGLVLKQFAISSARYSHQGRLQDGQYVEQLVE